MRDASGVHNAIDNKGAFLSVTRSNMLKLAYQQDNQIWMETSFDLSELVDSDDVVTHAAFGDQSGIPHHRSCVSCSNRTKFLT